MAENAFKPIWKDAPVPDPGIEGDLITSRGTDPLTDTGGTSALVTLWDDAPIKVGNQTEETDNSVSGLPHNPNRYQPSEQPPPPPTLKRPTPGTIDEQ